MKYFKISNDLLKNGSLTEVLVFTTLLVFTNTTTKDTFVSTAKLAEVTGLCRETIIRTIQKLLECGHIEKVRRYNTSSIIKIKPVKKDYTEFYCKGLDITTSSALIAKLQMLVVKGTNTVYLSKSKIANKINISYKTLVKYLKELESKGLVSEKDGYITLNNLHSNSGLSYFCKLYERFYGENINVTDNQLKIFERTTKYNKDINKYIDVYFELFYHIATPFRGNHPNIWHFCHNRNQTIIDYFIKEGELPKYLTKCTEDKYYNEYDFNDSAMDEEELDTYDFPS